MQMLRARRRPSRHLLAAALIAASLCAISCGPSAPARTFTLTGQVIAIDPVRQELTIAHDDIPDLMPAMTMSFPVAEPSLLQGREPGERITATLEVRDAVGRIVAVTRLGFTPPTAGSAGARAPLAVGDLAPDAAFVDQRNARRSLAEWRGTTTVLAMVDTHCADPRLCPRLIANVAALARAMGADRSLRGRAAIVTIARHPETDTSAVIAAEAQRLGADPAVWTWLTGDRATVDRLAAALGVRGATKAPTAPAAHPLRTVVIDSAGRIAAIHDGADWTVAAIVADVRRAAARRIP